MGKCSNKELLSSWAVENGLTIRFTVNQMELNTYYKVQLEKEGQCLGIPKEPYLRYAFAEGDSEEQACLIFMTRFAGMKLIYTKPWEQGIFSLESSVPAPFVKSTKRTSNKSENIEKEIHKMEYNGLLYEGKAKKVYNLRRKRFVVVSYKDDATAFNGEKKGTIAGKGVVNNRMSNMLMGLLESKGIQTHYVAELSDTDTLVERLDIIPLEVIVRNYAAGSFCKRFGWEEGTKFSSPTIEFSYKNDELGDPMLADTFPVAMGLASMSEVVTIQRAAFDINDILSKFFEEIGIILVDFKLEFGRASDGGIILADEISPDTCRFWDIHTKKKLDKDRFRQNMGEVEEAYQEVFRRVEKALGDVTGA